MSGHSGEAYKELEDLMDIISFDWRGMGYIIDSKNSFIRIRSTSDNLNVYTWVLEVMVIGTLWASVVARIKITWAGGSSRVFRSALKADLDSI